MHSALGWNSIKLYIIQYDCNACHPHNGRANIFWNICNGSLVLTDDEPLTSTTDMVKSTKYFLRKGDNKRNSRLKRI